MFRSTIHPKAESACMNSAMKPGIRRSTVWNFA
jgi:hypothetical protein